MANTTKNKYSVPDNGIRTTASDWSPEQSLLVKADFFKDAGTTDEEKREARDDQSRRFLMHVIDTQIPGRITILEASASEAQSELDILDLPEADRTALKAKQSAKRTLNKAASLAAGALSEEEAATMAALLAKINAGS